VRRLVIVDDDELVRTSAGLYFEDLGWTVALAADAEQALACTREPFDVMICDHHLTPRRAGEGLAVLEEARRAAPHAVLVLLSGQGIADLGGVKPDAVLQKPFRLPQIETLLGELLAASARGAR
jgi:CheY-like chemotaxis protein